MTANRTFRRAMKRNAEAVAAKLASRCYDFQGGGIVPVSNPLAIAALTRAFKLLLRNGGQPLAVPVSEAEAQAFPAYAANRQPRPITWLAVGMDREGRATYAMQSASSDAPALAHEAARSLALSRLAETCAKPGFPMGEARGRA